MRSLRIAAALLAAVVGTSVLGVASPARADGPLVFTGMTCDVGAKLNVCVVSFTGGRPHYTIRWAYNGDPQPQFDDSILYRRGCKLNAYNVVSVTVTDVDGQSFSVSIDPGCSIIWQ